MKNQEIIDEYEAAMFAANECGYAGMTAEQVIRSLFERASAAEAKLATNHKWRELALQFDGHRMQALSLLKMIVNHAPKEQYPSVRNFLNSAPLSGEKVMKERLAEIVAAPTVPAVSLVEGLHPSTANLVISFAEALAKKLRRSEEKYGWSDGWKDADWKDKCLNDFHHHIGKGDPIDVAAYCAFMWHHGWATKQKAAVNVVDLVPVYQQLIYGNWYDCDKGEYDCSDEDSRRMLYMHNIEEPK